MRLAWQPPARHSCSEGRSRPGISSGGDWDLFAPFYQKDPQEPRDGFTANAFIGTLGPLDRRPSGEAGLEGWPWRQIARDMVQPHCVADLKEIEAAQECK